jgi:predicted lipoprotein
MLPMDKYIAKLSGLILFLLASPLTYGQNLITRDEDWTAINIAVTDELIIPAYQNLESRSLELISATENFCSDLSALNLDSLKNSYQQSMLAWQAIQHIQFGPITYFNWNYRMHYWPDERGASGRQLDALIASQDESVLTSNAFPRQSVGVQGLPSLEKLLYDANALSDFRDNAYLCSLTTSISRNINEISFGVTQRWMDEYRALILDPVAGGFYENAEDLSIYFLKALQESIAKVRDLKLAPAIGESFVTTRTRSAESWRSESSLTNIKNNLNSAELLFTAYSSAFYEEDITAIVNVFSDLAVTLAALPDSMVTALTNEMQYAQLQTLHAEVEALHEALETALKNTDLYLGFNSLDGD